MTAGDEWDLVDGDDFGGAGEGEIPRDKRWGKPRLPHPETGKVQLWRRPSSITGPLEDKYLLHLWEMRAVAKGVAHREHLRALAYASPNLDDPASRTVLNDVAREAMNWAGTHARAAKGTAQHMLFDAYNRTGAIPGDDQPAMRDDVLAYAAALKAYGLTIEVDLIERMGICPEVDAAGSWDGIGHRAASGEGWRASADPAPWPLPRILDAKTGTDPAEYHTMAYAAQQAIYARCKVMVPRRWDAERGADQYEPMPLVDQEHATLIWIELGTATVQFIDVDLVAGWELAQLALDIFRWRKRKDLLVPAFTWPRVSATADPELDGGDAYDGNPELGGSLIEPERELADPASLQVPLDPPVPPRPRTPAEQVEREREVQALLDETSAGKTRRAPAKRRKPPTADEIEATRVTVLAERRAATLAREAADPLPPFVETIRTALDRDGTTVLDSIDVEHTTVGPVLDPPNEHTTLTAPALDSDAVADQLAAALNEPVPDPPTDDPAGSYCAHGAPACGPCAGRSVTEWTLTEKVREAATREVLSALWAAHRDVWSDELTALGKTRLAQLGG